MAKVYRNYTVGLDEITYNQLKDLALLNRTSIRQYLTNLVSPQWESSKESISKLKEVFNSIDSSQEVTPNTIAKET